MTVLLLRHMPTKKNHNGIFIGQLDDPIIDGLSIEYNDIPLENKITIFFSPLLRCVQTLAILVKDLLLSKQDSLELHFITSDNIIERNFGDIQGKIKKEVYAMYPEQVINGILSTSFSPPNCELFQDFFERVKAFYDDLILYISDRKEQILICSHLHVFRLLKCLHYDLNVADNWHLIHIPYGSITVL